MYNGITEPQMPGPVNLLPIRMYILCLFAAAAIAAYCSEPSTRSYKKITQHARTLEDDDDDDDHPLLLR